VSDKDSLTDAMLQCARANRPTPFIWYQGVTHSHSSHSLYWHVCSLIFFSDIYLCACVAYVTSLYTVRRVTEIRPNIDKRTIHENVKSAVWTLCRILHSCDRTSQQISL